MNIQGNENIKKLMNGIFDTYASKEAITYMKDDGTKAYFSFQLLWNFRIASA